MTFSGGGIRAATFALGAWNALSGRASEVVCDPLVVAHRHDTTCDERSPRLVAVSGGSYLAAAIALVARWTIVDRRPQHRGD